MRFTLRRPASAEVSTCCYRPSGGDVACGVHVGVRPISAGNAPEHRLALAVFLCAVPADRAGLRRERGFDLLYSTRSLVLQAGYQQAPGVSEDASVQPGFGSHAFTRLVTSTSRGPGHAPDIEVFGPDQIKPASQIGARLLDPVFASILFSSLELRDRSLDLAAPTGARHAPGEPALQPPKSLPFTVGKSRHGEKLPRGEGSRDRHTAIHSHYFAVAGCGDRGGDGTERDVPPAGRILGDPVRIHAGRHCAGPAKPCPSNLWHPDLADLAAEPLHMTGLHRNLPESFISSGFAPRRAAVSSCDEVLHGMSEIPQRLLLHRHRPSPQPYKFGPRLGQLASLLVISRRGTTARPPASMLLDRQIPDEPGMPGMLQEPGLLVGCRQQSVTGHGDQRNGPYRQNRTQIRLAKQNRIPSPAKPGGFHRLEFR